MEQYTKYMERRSELIKEGKSLSFATNTAFEEIYRPEKPDQMSYANR